MATSEWRRDSANVQRPAGLLGSGEASPVRFILLFLGAAALLALALALLWYAGKVLLLTFGGIILAVFLWGLSDWLSHHTRLNYGWSLAVVLVALVGVIALLVWLLASSIIRQSAQLADQLPQSLGQLEHYLRHTDWGRHVLHHAHRMQTHIANANMLTTARDAISVSVETVVDAILVVLVGIYGAATPEIYCNGIVRLFPFPRRPRIREALHAAGYTLWWWMLCRLVSMAWVGVTTALALWLLGVQPALALGVLAGLLKFVPYLGPIAAVIPAALMALLQGPWMAVWVVLLYWGLEMIDDHVIMPLLNWGAIWLPPALAIFAQVLFGTLWGIPGVLFAMPVAAILLTLVKMLYVEDRLGDATQVPGQDDRAPAATGG